MENKIIFDLDGLLLDTEVYYSICWKEACKSLGYDLTYEQGLNLRSLDSKLAEEYFRALFGEECPYEDIRSLRKELMKNMIAERGINKKKGCDELLDYLRHNNIDFLLATSSSIQRAQRLLKMAGLENQFQTIVSTSMVKHGKPYPDVYLEACMKVDENPENCIAIEDSPNGVKSAYTAGCKVIMVPDLTEPEPHISHMLFSKAESLIEVINILGNHTGLQSDGTIKGGKNV